MFLKLGITSFGASTSEVIIENISEKKGWLSLDNIRSGIAVAGLSPGPFHINLVMNLGYQLCGFRGLLLSLYSTHANPNPIQLEPFKSFKDLPGSMPYQGPFSVNTERTLIPHVPGIKDSRERILHTFGSENAKIAPGGDFSLLIYPLPKIALCYIFYLPDDEFPAAATCLFSANALSFMPMDGLADVGEYTSKKIIGIIA